ncbi:unnamed protein product, partial [marine sediment metagenome]
ILMAIPAIALMVAKYGTRVIRILAPYAARGRTWLLANYRQILLAAGIGATAYVAGEIDVENGAYPTDLTVPPGGGLVPFIPSGGIPDEWVAYTWDTGTAVFYRLIDGRIAVQRKNGLWKVYRPKKHIVINTNPRMSQVSKLFRTCTKITKRLAKTRYLKTQ